MIQEIMNGISTVGFPIVCTLIMAYVWYDGNQKHAQETQGFIKAIDNNTKAIELLSERMENNETT